MKRKHIFLIIGIVMLTILGAAMVSYFGYAITHPEFSITRMPKLAMIFCWTYLIVMCGFLITSLVLFLKNEQKK